jgi:hypothetical protein
MNVSKDKILLFPNFRTVDILPQKKMKYEYIYVGRMTKDK